MRKIYLFIIFYACILDLSSQTIQSHTSSNFQFTQENNAVLVSPLYNEDGQGGLLLPFEAGKNSAQTLEFLYYFLGGRQEDGSLWSFFKGLSTYTQGPLTAEGSYSEGYDHAFDSIWVVTRMEILRYLNDWEDGRIDFQHKAILGWPAKGNTILLQDTVPLPDRELAPFYDRNGNGIYEPLEGEYPSIHGDLTTSPIPTFLSWNIFNTGFSGNKNLEFQNITYAYSCEQNTVLDNNVFFKIKIKNRGFAFDTLFAGFQIKGELGCDEDDYWGADTSSHTVYFYNEEPGITENCLSGGEIHPPSHKISQAFTFLDRQLHAAIDYRVYEYLLGTRMQFYTPQIFNMMKGLLHTGQAIPYGWGSPLQNDSVFTRYLYPELPTNTSGWNMINSDIPRYRDWSPWASCHLKDFHDSENVEINFALTTLLDTSESLTNYTVVEKLVDQHIPKIKQHYQSNFTDIDCGNRNQFCEPINCVWPGDGNTDQRCFLDDFLYTGWLVKESISGPKRSFENDEWDPQYAEDWPENFKGINHKYYDASGDGIIDLNDLAIIKSNLHKKTPYYNFENWREPEASDVTLTVPDITFNNYLDTPGFFRWIELPLTIESTSSQGVADLHSICFSLEWDSSLFDLENPRNQYLFTQAKRIFVQDASASLAILNERELFVVFCEPSDTSYNGEFIIAEFRLFMKNDLFDRLTQDSIMTPVRLKNVRALRADGTEIDMALKNGSITLTKSTVSSSIYLKAQQMALYPNPVRSLLRVKSANSNKINSVSIYNINHVLQLNIQNLTDFETAIDVSKLPEGMYIIIAKMEDGNSAVGKFVKI